MLYLHIHSYTPFIVSSLPVCNILNRIKVRGKKEAYRCKKNIKKKCNNDDATEKIPSAFNYLFNSLRTCDCQSNKFSAR